MLSLSVRKRSGFEQNYWITTAFNLNKDVAKLLKISISGINYGINDFESYLTHFEPLLLVVRLKMFAIIFNHCFLRMLNKAKNVSRDANDKNVECYQLTEDIGCFFTPAVDNKKKV